MRRGRPRHDDVLTPREWQVLDLLRGGLTNEQIAAQLGISPDTAKFHVSEILSKLNVQTRQEAAAWQGRPRRVPSLGLPSGLARFSPLQLAGAAVIAAAVIGLTALTAGVLLTESRPGARGPAFAPDGRTGIEQVDALIDRLLNDDAAALGQRFAGVDARQGSYDPAGLYDRRDVAVDEWTARLAGSQRVLYAVVRDPPEAYRPPGPQGLPLLATPREFDVVLVVEEGGAGFGWRFSLAEGGVIDLVITPDTNNQPGGMRPNRGLRGLTPSPVDQQASFLVLPPEDSWPPPAPYAGSGRTQWEPAPVNAPTFAPDGRTGDQALDAIIETLLEDDADAMQRRFGELAARQNQPAEPGNPDSQSQETVRIRASDWMQRLAASPRRLHAVFTDAYVDVRLLLSVQAGGGQPEAWQFGLVAGHVVELEIYAPFGSGSTLRSALVGLTPNVPFDYERFYVLPPQETLPRAPTTHPLSVRTGEPGVDRLLDLLQARDAKGLQAAISSPGELLALLCIPADPYRKGVSAEAWSQDVAGRDLRLHAVARIPDGYEMPADHVIILVTALNPYRWKTIGIYEEDGQILGVSPAPDYSCEPEGLYPPRGYLVPPPQAGSNRVDPARRSGLPIVDVVLDAAQAGDVATMRGLIDYRDWECPPPDIVTSRCPPGVAAGTVIKAIRVPGSHGPFYAGEETAPGGLIGLANDPLYAVFDAAALVPSPFGLALEPGTVIVVLAEGERSGITLAVGPKGVIDTWQIGGQGQWRLPGRPDFLLPPP